MNLFLEKDGVSYSKSCLMWNIPDPYADLILAWGRYNISNKNVYNDAEESLGRENLPHVTVLYGLHTKNHETVRKIIEKFPIFPLYFGKITKFSANSEKPYDVLKIEVHSNKLHELHDLVKNSMENSETWPTYNPHTTLAYCKPGTCDNLLGKAVFKDTMTVLVRNTVFSCANNQGKTIISLGN